jgi:hypothetical protein
VTGSRRPQQAYYKAQGLEWALARRYGPNPPEALRAQLGREYLRAAYLLFAQGEKATARAAYQSAQAAVPGLATRGTLVEEVLDRYLLRSSAPANFELVEALFRDLLDPTPHLARLRSRLQARLHVREAFAAAQAGRSDQVASHLWPGVRADPRWALNRGVLSLLARQVFRRI